MKAKQQEQFRNQQNEKQQEISKKMKKQENLSKLEAYVKKKMQKSFVHNQQQSLCDHHTSMELVPDFDKVKFKERPKLKARPDAKEKLSKTKRESTLKSEIERILNEQVDQKENLMGDLNIFSNEIVGASPQKASMERAQPGKPADEYQNLDEQFKNFIKKGKDQQNISLTSQSLLEFGEKVTGSSFDHDHGIYEITPKNYQQQSSLNPQVIKSINDIVKRSRSQQRRGATISTPGAEGKKSKAFSQLKHSRLDQTDSALHARKKRDGKRTAKSQKREQLT